VNYLAFVSLKIIIIYVDKYFYKVVLYTTIYENEIGEILMAKNSNPLQGYLRSPKLYVLLPSGGKFSNIESISDISQELPIYPLTSMDETLLRNPDALLNGESMAKVITSCTGIQNAYELTANDVDVILLAIRYATYGNDLEISTPCTECNATVEKTVEIEPILETIEVLEDSYMVTLDNNLRCYLKPYTLRDSQKAALSAFRETSELNTLINAEADEMAKLTTFNKSFQAMADLNIEILSNAVVKVIIPAIEDTEQVEVTNKNHIEEWVRGISKQHADVIIDELNVINELGVQREVEATCEACTNTFKTKIEFNPSNFFDLTS
jgi:hypothetical protein